MPERYDVVLGHSALGGRGRHSGGWCVNVCALLVAVSDCVSPRVVCPRGFVVCGVVILKLCWLFATLCCWLMVIPKIDLVLIEAVGVDFGVQGL
jgi:hypothetical protein